MASIGFIGLGIMGKGMVRNLLQKSSAPFVVWNRSADACTQLASEFPDRVTVAATPKDVVQAAGTTYCMLSTAEASSAVYDCANGILDGVGEGKVIVDCATLAPDFMCAIDQRVSGKGGRFLEAPVSGSKGPAEQGSLIFLCGGDQALYEAHKDQLLQMGKAAYLFGPVGKGNQMKLVVNMTMGSVMTSFAEGLALCEAADLPTSELLEVLSIGAIGCPMYQLKGPKMASREYAPNFPLKHAQKDMRLALEMGKELGLSLPTTKAANEEYLKALDAHGDEDFSAVYEQSSKKA
mmetsp:Transcript_14707/g.24389  ORF Transcript_14707/g.24389 Transcript_14707/m.24389 type:complete len:293 (-) Transcript_14707:1744-2622(-)|eukprot:CAMPEP_0114450004 /NCGR_PEP_ID=MMETSP0104-20121206/233_1 /TAXON_ID=37642 ORGANISM="Paraphysomonas imperforata, Strain PA2" /NCGR_SAMPLE_ID=MMETSP0104 /ASSEMBLY_ACC=CAM_ASM_000202 /LENGTH=292 /DNA_ID=CAMNT_0001622125 /DNA_START=42 /DNA_END=920 /DNA_ORIENTATION=-